MKIGKLELGGRPDPERLLASTGYSPAAMHELLERLLHRRHVAAALLACTGDKLPDRHELATLIAEAGVDQVRAEVRELYAQHSEGSASGEN
jgi:hypothetical protein